MIQEKMIGPHRLVQNAEDVITMYFAPNPTAAEMTTCVETQAEIMGGRPYFLLLDFAQVESLSADTRRAVGESTKKVNYRAIGMCNASFQMKVIARLINVAIGLFTRRPFPQEFFDRHEDALAWFDDLRKRDTVGAA